VFGNCTSLTNIAVDASNPAYSSLGGVLLDKAKATLIQFPAGVGGSYSVTNSVNSIGDNSFEDCYHLTSVSIPNSVTNIGLSAFVSCSGMTKISIPDGITNIGTQAFFYCLNLTSLTISSNVTSLGDYAFAYCAGLTSVTIPSSVTSFGNFAFAYCAGLTNVTISSGVTSIGEAGFASCSNLTSVIIPSSVTSIGEGGFASCTSLKSAYFKGNAPPDNGTGFFNDTATVYYLYGTTGWGPTFGSVPAVLWNPQAHALNFTGGHFGFNLTGPTNSTIIVEACTNLSRPVWLPVVTNTFSSSGTSTFSDLQSGAHPTRFYRERSP
jgi:BspA type Leucine rich repeat region (6 copies)